MQRAIPFRTQAEERLRPCKIDAASVRNRVSQDAIDVKPYFLSVLVNDGDMVLGIIVWNAGLRAHVGNSQSSHEDGPVRVNGKGNGSTRSITVEKHLPSSGLPGKFYPGLQGE